MKYYGILNGSLKIVEGLSVTDCIAALVHGRSEHYVAMPDSVRWALQDGVKVTQLKEMPDAWGYKIEGLMRALLKGIANVEIINEYDFDRR